MFKKTLAKYFVISFFFAVANGRESLLFAATRIACEKEELQFLLNMLTRRTGQEVVNVIETKRALTNRNIQKVDPLIKGDFVFGIERPVKPPRALGDSNVRDPNVGENSNSKLLKAPVRVTHYKDSNKLDHYGVVERIFVGLSEDNEFGEYTITKLQLRLNKDGSLIEIEGEDILEIRGLYRIPEKPFGPGSAPRYRVRIPYHESGWQLVQSLRSQVTGDYHLVLNGHSWLLSNHRLAGVEIKLINRFGLEFSGEIERIEIDYFSREFPSFSYPIESILVELENGKIQRFAGSDLDSVAINPTKRRSQSPFRL
jgi:hypothetical protein